MKKIFAVLILSLLVVTGSVAQANRYIIRFRDKADNPFNINNPPAFLSQKAILRRIQYNIPLDSTDLPVTPRYLDSVRLSGAVTILNSSKWLNQVAIQTTDAAALARINSLPFVLSSTPIAALTLSGTAPIEKLVSAQSSSSTENLVTVPLNQNLAATYNYGKSGAQIRIHQGEFLHNLGFRGEGMTLAMLDAGFLNYQTIRTFDSMRNNNQVLGTWDFVSNNTSVNEDHVHGMWCLSSIAANIPDTFVGTAPKTSFYLFRTEDAATEYPIEEHFYAAGLEKADSLGVEISSTSLGYFDFQGSFPDHTYADMDGNTTMAARAADMAARKGMLLLVAAGNEGNKAWHYLVTPSDADSILSVGAVDSLGNVGDYSSYGPSSDGQVKPGVAAVGTNAVVANLSTGLPQYVNGTSLACPNMAGLATCLWQAFPEENNMGIIRALQQSAHKFNNPDDRVGYGIPDMKKAFVILLKRSYRQEIKQVGCSTLISWTVKSNAAMNFDIQRKLPTDADYITIANQAVTGGFNAQNFNYSDDLAALGTPVSVNYRIRMNISTDTSFSFTPVQVNHNNACMTYTFTGNGSWTNPGNWASNLVPPAVLPAGSTIIINPAGVGECILNISQQVQPGAAFIVKPSKKLLVPGNLITQ